MAKGTFVQLGAKMDYTNGGAAAIGYMDIVPLVTRVAVAMEDIAIGAVGALDTEGVYEAAAVTGTAFAAGDQLYWDATNSRLTKTATDNTPAGYAFAPKLAAGTTALVKIG